MNLHIAPFLGLADLPQTMAGRWLLTPAHMVSPGEFYVSRDESTVDGLLLLLGADNTGHLVGGSLAAKKHYVMKMALSSPDRLILCSTKNSAEVSNYYYHDYYGTLTVGADQSAVFAPWKAKP